MPVNKSATRYFSKRHEESVAKAINGKRTLNSGATKFDKGDVINDVFCIECKTCMKEKEQFIIKKEWINASKQEAISQRKYPAICFNFGNNSDNYYIITESMFIQLNEYLKNVESE